MSHAATSQFFDSLKTTRLLDDSRIDELRARPEATWGDVDTLSNYAQDRGWLTAYQVLELREGRGDQLAVGGYRIFDKVSDGPAGVTYKALHPALQTPVTLRVLRADWLTPADNPADYLDRTHAAALVQSPHLATVLDSGTHGDQTFVVQEYVDGCDLFYLVNEMGALPLGLACEYARQAAVALKAAHDKGVAHGDVSPFTLLLTPVKRANESNGDVSVRPRPGATIKLADLGLSPRRPPVGELTLGESDRLGPVAFYPPERLTSGDRTPAGDLYGLGATLYYLLTTKPPHSGSSPAEVFHSLQQNDPPPLESLKPEVGPAVAVLVRQLLSRDAAARPNADRVIDTLMPFCEPSAMTGAVLAEPPVLLASETGTLPGVPTAMPVAKDLDRSMPAAEPFAEAIPNAPPPIAESIAQLVPPDPVGQPLVEPLSDKHLLPEVQPLDDHHGGSGDHLQAFEHTSMGADKPRAPRPKVQATSKNKAMIVAGLILHLTGTILCLGFLGIIPNPFKSKPTQPPDQPVNIIEKNKDGREIKKVKR